jgi:hypothetical protein
LNKQISAQTKTHPAAKFSFNNGSDVDEVSKHKIKLIGTSFTQDRFGNNNHAIFLSGHAESYINLGNFKSLKPKAGTISLWIKIENPVAAGQGIPINPILLTKCDTLDNFYEAYSIHFEPETEKIAVSFTKDSTKQVNHFADTPFRLNKWWHLVIVYDNNFSLFYLDGKLQNKFPKNFETKFLDSDSVLIGSTGNKKNQRFLKADIDDVAFYDVALTNEEVEELFFAPNPNKNKIILNWALVCLIIIVIGTLFYFLIKQRIKLAVTKERLRLELNNKLLETELRVNRASMNPHFLFNSLNALHNLILNNEIDNASDYLVKFSKLIRKILDSNMYESISLELEIELLELYLELENLRFEENIKYTIVRDDSLVLSSIHIPIMMLQPFIENAIWHGLLNKTGEKSITITFSLYEEKYIYCTIEDNGTGRKKTNPGIVEKKSLATGFLMQRLELLNKIHGLKCSMLIEDKPNSTGTIVKIILPILNK